MASGDIKQSGMWKCVNDRDGTVYKTGGYWPYSIYYSEYSNGVTLVNYDSTKCSEDPIEWIEYNYNGKTVYIQNKLFFYSISIAESLRLCSNNGIYIDNVKYKLSFMPKEFWTNLPSSICTLFKTDTSKKFYTNSPFYTDSTSYYYSVHFDGNSFSYDSESIGENTIDETYAFVPVLVQDNNFNVGDIVRFGRWKLTSDSGDITYLVENSVDYTLYNKIEIDTSYTGNDALGWFVYEIDNKKAYISNETGINWITLNEAKNFCNKIVEINNEKYTYTLMSVEQWTSIRKTYVHLCFFIPETREILTSSTKTVSVKENAFVENTTTHAEDNRGYGFLYYIPVLVQDNSFNDENTVRFGRWITNSGDYIYDNYSEIDLSHFVSVQLDPDYTDSNALTWVEGQVDSHKCYFAKHLLINYMSYNKARQLCNNTYTINGNEYKLTLLTRSQWESLPSSVYSNLQYPTLYGGGTQEYIFTSETSNSYVYGAYRTSNDQAFSTELIPTGIITDFDTVSGYVYFAPVLVSSNNGSGDGDVPDGTVVEMGMTYDSYNGYNSTASMTTIYPVDGFTRAYDINADVNIVRTLKIVDYNSSHTQETPMDWVAYNYQNKLYYISRTTFIRGNISDTFDICNNNKTIYLNGKYYEMTTMPIEFWTGLPSSVKNNMEIVDLNMHTDSEVQVSTSNESMQTGYRTVSFDINTMTFVESRPVVSGIQGEAGCAFIPVLTQVDINTTVKTVKMGMLIDHEFRIERGTTADHDFYMSDNTYANNYDEVNYTFATASTYEKEHDMEWEWLEVMVDGTLMYVSTTNAFLAYPIGYYYNNIKDRYICIDNKYYIFRLLSESQWKSLPTHMLNKIDWLNSNGNSTLTLTSSSIAIGYNPINNTWDYSMSYDSTSTSIVSAMGCIPVLEPIDSGIVKMGIVTMYENSITIEIPAIDTDRYIIFNDKGSNDVRVLNWTIATLNDKTVLIANDFLSTDMTLDSIKSYIDKIVYFNGNQYKIKILSQEQWRNLPASVLNNINFSYGSTNYYTYTSSTDSGGNHIFLTRNSDGTFTIVTMSDVVSSTIEKCGLLLVLEYEGTGVDHIKLGALTKTDGTIVKKNCSYDGFGYGFDNGSSSLDNYNFTNTDNESLKWPWIKTELNGDTILFSKMSVGPSRYLTLIENGIVGREYILENNKYQLIGMSIDELKQLDIATLSNIDFGHGCSATFRMFTNEVTGTSTSDTVKTISYNIYTNLGDVGFEQNYEYIDVNSSRAAYYPILKLMNKPPTISGTDSNLGDKTQAFSIEYTVDDSNTEDSLTVTEKLNGTTIRTINSAVRNQEYSFNITSSMFANLALYETNTMEITVNDGIATATRKYTFRKTNTAPVINYTGNTNLGLISSKPTINYSVTDAEGDEITITERLNGKVLQTYTVSSGTECSVNVENLEWLGCGNSTNTIEINARDAAGGSSNLTITFVRAIDRIEVITNPIKTNKAVTKISLEVGWNTENASGQVFVCNNAYDASPTWENMTNSVGSNLVYNITNTTKTAAEWGVSVKVIVKKDGGSTGEVSLYSIKGTYE